MSSDSDSSSKKAKRNERSRSRSREKRVEKPENRQRQRDRDRRKMFKAPEMTHSLYTFKQFYNLQTEKMSNESIQKGYEKYKKEWEQKQNEDFLKQYKNDAWFSEKYDPEVLDLLEKDRRENNRRLSSQFLARLQDGYYDKIDFRVKDPSLLGVVEQIDEEEQAHSNLSYIINQTFDIHMNQHLDITKQPFHGFDQDLCTLFVKAVPRSISRYDIRSVVEKLEGYKYLTMSDPVKKMNLTRYCWIQFDSQQTCSKAVMSLSGLIIKNQTLIISKSSTKVKRVKVLKNYPLTRIQKDIKTLAKLIVKLDQEFGISENKILEREFADLHTKFDTFLLYLRRVHAYDYFTSTIYQNQRILALKVGSAFLRMEADYQQLQNVQTVFKKIQEKAEQRAEKGLEIPDYMGYLRDEIEVFIRETEKLGPEEQKEVWKCLYCDKKFKTCQFLSKHMMSKHEQIKFKKIQIIMEQLYLKDPFKITYSSLNDRDPRRRNYTNNNYRREKRRQYKDFDEPEGEKAVKTVSGKQMVNFLDI